MNQIKAAWAAASAWLQRTGWTAVMAFCLGMTLMIAIEATLEALGW